jgi:dTDP-4-amino-4,6-dideoxygalactose transaminase
VAAEGDVFVPAPTFAATANTVVRAGARPFFGGVNRSSWTLDANPARVVELLQQRLDWGEVAS